MSSRTIVFVAVGIAFGYLLGAHVGVAPEVCPQPTPCVTGASCPCVTGAPCPIQKECPTPPPPCAECPEVATDRDDITLVPDRFPADPFITDDPIPITDHHTEHIVYEDQHVHNYGKMPAAAKKENVWLVVYVPTAVGFGDDQQQNFMVAQSVREKGQPSERREIIRKNFRGSWLYRNGQARMWFVLSTQSPLLRRADFKKRIDEEAREFGDLFFADCPDVDNDFNPPSGTTIKMGDDVHFNVDQLYRLIVVHRKVPHSRVFMGTKRFINNGVRTPAQAKRFGSHYPAYPQGLGYVLSADIAIRLGRMVQMGVPFLTDWPEDAIVASWITGWGIHIIDSLRWFHNKMGSGGPEFACVADSIMTHDLSPAQLRNVDATGVWRC